LLPQLDPDEFRQISRGAIVNMRHVTSASRDDAGKLTLHLRDRTDTLRVSPLFAHLFRQM
jgi:DNA-binding LytR/AlgR family response regulator